MADTIQFVDAIAQTPNVLLDLNDEVKWSTRSFSAPTPRLRRAMSTNAMRDGVFVSSSQYDARTLTIGLDLVTTDQDANALELQKLFRLLDAPSILRYRPEGATKAVFFKVYRSDAAAVIDVIAAAAFRQPEIELLAEPFALGERTTLGTFPVSNDPADTNGMFFDLTDVPGDVPAPVVLVSDGEIGGFLMVATRSSTDPDAHPFVLQAEDFLVGGSDTTNPGGSPDPAYSGTGSKNYIRTTFATAPTQQLRLVILDTGVPLGTYRLLACVRRTDTSVFELTAAVSPTVQLGPVQVPTGFNGRVLVDMGTVTISGSEGVGYGPENTLEANPLGIGAGRLSGAGALDYDYFLFMPASESTAILTVDQESDILTRSWFLDGINDREGLFISGDPLEGTAVNLLDTGALARSGALPMASPGLTTRVYVVTADWSGGGRTPLSGDPLVTTTQNVTAYIWPQYLHVRPSSS